MIATENFSKFAKMETAKDAYMSMHGEVANREAFTKFVEAVQIFLINNQFSEFDHFHALDFLNANTGSNLIEKVDALPTGLYIQYDVDTKYLTIAHVFDAVVLVGYVRCIHDHKPRIHRRGMKATMCLNPNVCPFGDVPVPNVEMIVK